jgi:methyl-accepting chemotaxis protein
MSSALLNSSQAAMEIANIAKQQDTGIDEVLKTMNQVYLATEEAMTSTKRVADEAKSLRELANRIESTVRVNGALTGAPQLKMPKALLKLTGGQQ